VDSHLHGALDSPFVIDGHALQVGASVGRAAFPTDAKDAEGLLRAADAAMFETKRRHHQLTPELARSR
jgi:predicted signal transduction protein with EAL and GGDEF domain